MSKIRTVVFYKEYFREFFIHQKENVQRKIIRAIEIVETLDRIPKVYLKHIEGTNGLYEIRVKQGGDIYRVFCFFDEGRLVILANGFQKKSQKTPANEIQRALRIKKEYENEK
jgi:phage-related protein